MRTPHNFLKTFSSNRWLAVFLIILFGAIAYHNCLGNEMFWDDDDFINNNRYIKDLHYWPLWFSQNMVAGSYLVSNYWRPLLLAIFAVEWHFFHNWVYGWHFVAVSAHVLAAVTLFFLINRLFKRELLALLVALIFVVHPTENEAVVYVNSMGDALAAFFVLSCLLLYIRFRQSQNLSLVLPAKGPYGPQVGHSQKLARIHAWSSIAYWVSLLLFILGLLCKETAFVLVGLLPLTDLLLLQKSKTFWVRIQKTMATAWPFWGLGLIYVVLRATVLNFANSFNFYKEPNLFSTHISIRLMTFFKAMVQYTGFLFFPYQLRVERELPWGTSLLQWDVLLGALLVGFMVFCIFKYWRTAPWVSFGLAWFFIAIAPTSNVLVPINAIIYEHFLYIPMMGITLIVAHFGLDWAEKYKALPTVLKTFGVVLIIFCAVDIHRNLDWRTSVGFYEQLAGLRPYDYRVINNLGMEYANKGIQDKALTTYLRAIALDPQNPVAYHNIAGLYRDTGHVDLAIRNFQKAVSLNPDFIFSYRSLAALYLKLGDYKHCRENLLQLLRIDPTDTNARHFLEVCEANLTHPPSALHPSSRPTRPAHPHL